MQMDECTKKKWAKGVVVTTSGLTKAEKIEAQCKIKQGGGGAYTYDWSSQKPVTFKDLMAVVNCLLSQTTRRICRDAARMCLRSQIQIARSSMLFAAIRASGLRPSLVLTG